MIPASAPPATLPRLTANQAQALSLIARHGADIAVTLPPADGADAQASAWRVSLTPGAVDALRAAADWRADLEWAGAALRLHLPRGAVSAWLNARAPALAAGTVPEPLLAAALEALLGDVVAALGRVSPGGPLRVLDTGEAGGEASLPHIWTLTARAASGDTAYAVLEADGLGLMLLAGLLGKTAPAAGDAVDADVLPVALRAELGATWLPAGELRALQINDVVLLDEYLVGPQGELWLGIPQGQGLRVRAEQSSYLVTQGWTPLMTQTATPPEAAAGEPLDVDAIPVRLTFDLGERTLTLAELRRLQPGETFDLQRPLADGPVMIRANGALVGTGTLVELDGRVGVTIGTLGKGGA
jgi:type III secretion protein Q